MYQRGQRSILSGLRATLGMAAAAVFSISAIAQPSMAQNMPVRAQSAPAVVAASMSGSSFGASGSITRVTTGAEMLHLIVGHSLFLNTKFRLHRVYVADPAMLNEVTLSPNQIIVTAMTPGVSSLILLDEEGQAQSYVVSSDLDVEGLRTAISEAMRDSTVNVEGSGSRVILSGQVNTQALADTAVKLATLYTKDVANSLAVVPDHPKQVRLKVRILEVDRSKANQFGINLFNPGGNTSFLAQTTTGQYPSSSTLATSTSSTTGTIGPLTTSNPLNFLLYSSKLNLGATIQDLESKQVLQILAEPTITTISGEKADFLSGGEFPFPVIQPGSTGGAASVSITFKPYGVKLEFTPIVNDDGTIRLKVAPEVSALDYTNAVTISGYSIPALSTRKADTEVELRDNQSFAISGLLDQRTTDLYSKTPGVASIPILGALFKSKNVNHSTTELVVIITPTLVDPLSETVEPSQPGIPIPTLNKDKFDKSLGKNRNPNPVAPPLDPSKPTSSNQAAPASTPSAAGPATTAAVPDPATSVPQNLNQVPPPAAVPAVAPPAPEAVFGVATESIETPAPSQLSAPEPTPSPAPVAVTALKDAPPALAPQVTQQNDFEPVQPAEEVKAKPTQAVEVAKSEPVEPAMMTMKQPIQPGDGPAMVQVMALSHKEDADAMVAALKRHGYDVAIARDPNDSLIHLEVGPFSNKSDAEAMRQKLLRDGYNATLR
jgi:pilus assembly protein CpaC